MKQTLIFAFFINLFLLNGDFKVYAQSGSDTITPYQAKYGLRVGVDLSRPVRTLVEEDYRGLEIIGDYRLTNNIYIAAELGNEQLPFQEGNLKVLSNGSYIKVGADYNAYENWTGMDNIIFAGVRYGFATFTQTLDQYSIYTNNQIFPEQTFTTPIEYSGLTSSWVELVFGIKVEVLNNLFLGINAQLKRRVSQTNIADFDILTIPGFNRTFDESQFGAGYGYTISYLIPLYKKDRN